jgi:hypothetical protein
MKELKKMEFDGQKVKVQRYRPLEQSGDSGYDKVTGKFCRQYSVFALLKHPLTFLPHFIALLSGTGKALKDNAAIDKFCMSTILKDFMHLDPATRYQIAKNAFFRALYDARVGKKCAERQYQVDVVIISTFLSCRVMTIHLRCSTTRTRGAWRTKYTTCSTARATPRR